MTLHLLRYNNYYNRVVKKELTLEAYQSYVIGAPIKNVNFFPNDGVNTTQVINWADERPDYLIVADEDELIISRWFVVESRKTTAGQYVLTLHRDLVADYYDEAMSCPAFVEKGWINDKNDTAIYNQEDMSFNKVKKREIPLADASGCPWVVGYIPRDSFQGGATIGPIGYPLAGSAALTLTEGLSSWEYFRYIDKEVSTIVPTNVRLNAAGYYIGSGNSQGVPIYRVSVPMNWDMQQAKPYLGNLSTESLGRTKDTAGKTEDPNSDYMTMSFYYGDDYRAHNFVEQQMLSYFNASSFAEKWTKWSSYFGETDGEHTTNYYLQITASRLVENKEGFTQISEQQYSELLGIVNKGGVIYDAVTKIYYKLQISPEGWSKTFDVDGTGGFRSYLDRILPTSHEYFGYTGAQVSPYNTSVYVAVNSLQDSPKNWTLSAAGNKFTFKLTQLSTELTTTISADRFHLSDSPYDMFCLPYVDGKQIKKGNDTLVSKTSKFAALFAAQSVALSLGQGAVYDIQLLPYCPMQTVLKDDGTIDVANVQYSVVEGAIGDSKQNLSVLIWANASSFTLDIDVNLPEGIDSIDKKIKHLTEMYRLCSPNYAGAFEFSPQMNNGVTKINVDCTYKPFNPYIHLNPVFGGLYGNDTNDERGLVCGGDFSTAQVTSAWADYQQQNKNYLAVFDRQIENLELTQGIERKKEKWAMAAGIVGGTVGGGISGALTGAKAGGVGAIAGALAGAAIGGGLSAAGGAMDLKYNDILRQEALDYKRDMFGMQMENIQALPQGLARTAADTYNNKLIPFIEVYEADVDTEKYAYQVTALKNKIKYNGMSVDRIDILSNYVRTYDPEDSFDYGPTYVKGRLIKVENLAEDFHIANAIADELFKGVFIPVEGEE